jgi:dihydrofolate reductase
MNEMQVTLIAAMDEERGIGKNGSIPWNNRADMKRFRNTTMDSPIIMGKNTFHSLPGVLGGRLNIVVSSSETYFPNCLHSSSLAQALCSLRASAMFDDVYIIGGAAVYEEALENRFVDRIELSMIPGKYDCDVFFPNIPPCYVPQFECEINEGHSKFLLKVLELVP